MKTKKQTLISSALILSATACVPAVQASTDYGPAIWRPVCSGHWYTTGYGKKFFVEHDIEGYYWSCIYYFQNCATQASVHYTINGKKDNSSDANPGEVTQMVADAYYAWHASCWNQHSIGTEHEGFVSNPAWFTPELYQASASLTRSKADKYGFSKDRNRVIGHDQKRIAGWPSWASANLGIDPYCNTHTDPGLYWDWNGFMALVNPVPPYVRYLSNNNSWQDIPTFVFGNPGDIQLAGDWDGNGTVTPGILRGNVWFMRNANNNGGVDITFSYGNAGDVPVVGDWDGNRTWTIGVFRNADASWHLRNANSTGAPNYSFSFGSSGDIPLTGDWDGNGTMTPGVYRPSTGWFFMRNANSSGGVDYQFAFGNSGDVPLAGDWNGDGIWTVGLYRPSTGQFFLKVGNTASAGFDTIAYGNAYEKPIVGDWDGNRTTTVGVLRSN